MSNAISPEKVLKRLNETSHEITNLRSAIYLDIIRAEQMANDLKALQDRIKMSKEDLAGLETKYNVLNDVRWMS